MKKHPNYEFIVAFAEGKEVEFKHGETGPWCKVWHLHKLDEKLAFRIKPKTKMINGFTVNAPMDKEPKIGCIYYFPSVTECDYFFEAEYYAEWDKKNFQRGLCFTNKKDAIAVAKAMLGIDPNTPN